MQWYFRTEAIFTGNIRQSDNLSWRLGILHYIIIALATFWIAKTPIFFHFPTPQFLLNRTVELKFTNVGSWLLH